ncbi:hypothetical protein LOTGIDRAFT_167044 [Lottia gigantea]|uniref:G-protein coupled receptors family 1 profile domain-containing protein n=1 Tax=Lottia gigantea TaxID=225164 RepID=V3ZZU2_LOTGI|nr:hypothetical protein LOTGIDRAFT_167044 [Lottia gigantea]ESO86521.1 hypothetical protein LOTGIDRAFT_167044 [Lottia gigantea]
MEHVFRDTDKPQESDVRIARILLLMPRLVFLILVFVVGSVGNVIVLYVYHFKWRNSTFTLFVKVLALLDLLNCFTSTPAAIILVLGQDHVYVDTLCAITPFLSLYTSIVSGILFVIIAVQRYLGICKPLKVSFELPLAKKLCLFAISLGVLPSMLRLFLDSGLTYHVSFNDIKFNITMCVVTEESRLVPIYKVYMGVLALLFFAIFGTLILLYVLMWRKMFRHADQRTELFQNQQSVRNIRQCNANKYNSFKIFFAVTVVFLVSYLPHLTVLTVRTLDHDLTTVRRAFYDLAYYSPLWNNAANPLIYSFFSAEFRFQCRELFCSKCCRKEKCYNDTFRMQSMNQASRRTLHSIA